MTKAYKYSQKLLFYIIKTLLVYSFCQSVDMTIITVRYATFFMYVRFSIMVRPAKKKLNSKDSFMQSANLQKSHSGISFWDFCN